LSPYSEIATCWWADPGYVCTLSSLLFILVTLGCSYTLLTLEASSALSDVIVRRSRQQSSLIELVCMLIIIV